ncbi:MAG: NlpC/P60 family protein [Lachnospiraceae bacterium]|nr:C40 family peptidase [Lachnospiraceae bacterium]MCI7040822.1 NlpC/P60 family protein [Lachnospiraceae bacterium]MDD7628401.1 NlpC/P60 family protein [Lachnospiraceae bacterium]MDY4119927.1 NlpC/P60 family protein [Lachnospiraceae bacterium]
MYRRKKVFHILAILLSFLMMISVVDPVQATTISDLEKEKQELEKQKEEAQNKQKEESDKLNSVSGRIDSIQGDADAVAEEIDEADAALVETLASVEIIEEELSDKEEEIKVTTAEYEKAKEKEEEQYEAMKLRIRFMYEKGDSTYLQLLLESQNFSEAVNKAEYITQLYDYDRRMLEEYEAAKEECENLKNRLEEEKAELEAQQHELQEEQKNLETLLSEKQKIYDNYEVQIAQARQEAAIYKANIKKQTEEIRNLEAASKKKDSEIEAAKKAEEEARKAQEEALRRQAEEAAGQSGESGSSSGSSSSGGSSSGSGSSGYASASSYAGSGSKGQQIASYACQFIGNPYVPGGTSLTDGADCSGFVWRVYKDFGYSVPRTSYGCRSAGTEVSYADAQPGDIVCYAGHVGLYIGNGQIVHASTQKTGIKITNATYKEILTIRRIV